MWTRSCRIRKVLYDNEHPQTNDTCDFDAISNKVRDSVKVIADFSMKNAADELLRDSS